MDYINICITCDDNYAKYAAVTIASVLANAGQDDNLKIYIITNNISNENKNKIIKLKNIKDFELKFIYPEEEIFKEYSDVKTTDYLSIASFYRLKLPSLISGEDKIIYLDCDIVVNTSLSEMFNINIENYYCGAIRDIGYKRLGKRIELNQNQTYINSGVLLINLKKWRNDNAEICLSAYAKENPDKIFLGDQDLINKCFADEILLLDGKWNVQIINYCSRSDYSEDFKILHYTGGSKPWKFGSYIPLKKYYFKYLNLTDYKQPDKFWHIMSDICAALLYFKHRPFFMIRPGFYKAVLKNNFNKPLPEDI